MPGIDNKNTFETEWGLPSVCSPLWSLKPVCAQGGNIRGWHDYHVARSAPHNYWKLKECKCSNCSCGTTSLICVHTFRLLQTNMCKRSSLQAGQLIMLFKEHYMRLGSEQYDVLDFCITIVLAWGENIWHECEHVYIVIHAYFLHPSVGHNHGEVYQRKRCSSCNMVC